MNQLTRDDIDALDELPPHEATRISCDCGHEAEFTSEAATTHWQGEIIGSAPTGVLLGLCPDCLHLRYAKLIALGSDEELELHIVFHDIAMEGETIAGFASQRQFHRELDKILGVDELAGVCPSCNGPLYEEDYHEGPDAPEIGWEYYRCTECETAIRPTTAERTG